MSKKWKSLFLSLFLFVVQMFPGYAWHEKEHALIARLALDILPESMPEFFRTAGNFVSHTAIDPDLFADRSVPALRHTERPEHYIDMEILEGRQLPPRREDYLAMIFSMGLDTHKTGLLPYAIEEWTLRLAMAFAEYRKWPNDPVIQAKTAVYAGILAHYSADLAMPLHTTIHYDGRAKADGSSSRTGIHARVDGLLRKLKKTHEQIRSALVPGVYTELFPSILNELEISHRRVDLVYDLEQYLPAPDAAEITDYRVEAFAFACLRHAVRFTSGLYLSAWTLSETLAVPSWLDRAAIPDSRE